MGNASNTQRMSTAADIIRPSSGDGKYLHSFGIISPLRDIAPYESTLSFYSR
jgi:hypothetical protein